MEKSREEKEEELRLRQTKALEWIAESLEYMTRKERTEQAISKLLAAEQMQDSTNRHDSKP